MSHGELPRGLNVFCLMFSKLFDGFSGLSSSCHSSLPCEMSSSETPCEEVDRAQLELEKRLYEPMSLKDRFGDLSGRLLQDAIFRHYEMKDSPKTVQFFDAEKNQLIYRHPANIRKQKVVHGKYVSSLLSKGLVLGVRGD
jgi:hypothetical protein